MKNMAKVKKAKVRKFGPLRGSGELSPALRSRAPARGKMGRIHVYNKVGRFYVFFGLSIGYVSLGEVKPVNRERDGIAACVWCNVFAVARHHRFAGYFSPIEIVIGRQAV